jgi:thiamine biosynthesis protein ThiS
MRLTLNGEKKDFPDGLTLAALLESLKLTPGRLACEVNRQIVRRADYPATPLKDGDEIEIVQMIGGG